MSVASTQVCPHPEKTFIRSMPIATTPVMIKPTGPATDVPAASAERVPRIPVVTDAPAVTKEATVLPVDDACPMPWMWAVRMRWATRPGAGPRGEP